MAGEAVSILCAIRGGAPASGYRHAMLSFVVIVAERDDRRFTPTPRYRYWGREGAAGRE